MARASVLLGPAAWQVRPLVGADVGVARSTGTLTLSSTVPGPGAGRYQARLSRANGR